MAWYTQAAANNIPGDNDSLVVAFSNLLQRFGQEVDPVALATMLTQDDPQIDWWSVAEYVDGVDMGIVSDASGWPTEDNAIVLLRRVDAAAAGVVDHYCLVADKLAHSIIDSLDGVIKPASFYGDPVSWASYVEEPEFEQTIEEAAPPDPGTTFKVFKGGMSIWQVARQLHMSKQGIIDLNDIEDLHKIPEGTVLKLPEKQQNKNSYNVDIEILDRPIPMHIIKEDGAKQWAFGNVKKYTDIQPSGPTYPVDTNVTIEAIAKVKIEGDTLAYYLDSHAVGNYDEVGHIKYTIGYNHSHLADGHVEKKVKPPEVVIYEKSNKEPVISAEPELPTTTHRPTLIFEEDDGWKNTFKPFDGTEIYTTKERLEIVDYEGRRRPIPIEEGKGIKMEGTFWFDGECYARPIRGPESQHWYGLPLERLQSPDEFMAEEVPLVERMQIQGGGALTPYERYWIIPLSKVLSQYVKLKMFITKNKNQKEQV